MNPNPWSDLNFYSGIFVGVMGLTSLILVCSLLGLALEFIFKKKKR